MQYLNNTVMDYSLIKLHSDIGKEILSCVKTRGPGAARWKAKWPLVHAFLFLREINRVLYNEITRFQDDPNYLNRARISVT